MPMAPGPHLDLLMDAIATEAEGHRALLGGDAETARSSMLEAARLYRSSWELAPPGSYGRLIGMLKAVVIAEGCSAGGARGRGDHIRAHADHVREQTEQIREQAEYARGQVGDPGESVAAHYALAIAALVEGDDDAAITAAAGMRGGSPAFVRTATAIDALARRDARAYEEAVSAIVADFEGRETHLTGVAIADTALMLERLAGPRGLACAPSSPLLPPV